MAILKNISIVRGLLIAFMLLIGIGISAQDLSNPATIGQKSRNQKVNKGLQVEDTTLLKGNLLLANFINSVGNDSILTTDTTGKLIFVLNGSGYPNQTLSYSRLGADSLQIQISSGNTIRVPISDIDNDTTNEIQFLGLGAKTDSTQILALSNGGLVSIQIRDADYDTDNEIQTLSISNDTIYLEGGGFVVIPQPAYDTLTYADTINWDVDVIQISQVTLRGNVFFAEPSNMVNGDIITVRIIQDGVGSRLITWWDNNIFSGGTSPILTTTVGRSDIISFIKIGGEIFASSVLNFL